MKIRYILSSWKFFLVIPHTICIFFLSKEKKMLIQEDIMEMNRRCGHNRRMVYYLVYCKPFRNLFYYRIGRLSSLLRILLRPYASFYIGNIKHIGGRAFVLNHPYGTVINAKSIGRNFTICQLTTIGNKKHGHNDLVPTIGDNVSLGANVNIIGDITIGNNVIVGAGSVVVNDVPDNCIVAGNPAKIIRYI